MNKGIPIIKKYEGLKLKAYLCPANVWTIGYGSTFYENGSRVKEGDVITIDRADHLLLNTVNHFEQSVRNMITAGLTDNQLGALTSFAFNVGTGRIVKGKWVGGFGGSTLRRKINLNPNDPSIKDEFLKWNKAGGRVLNGLTRRRKEEADLYFQT